MSSLVWTLVWSSVAGQAQTAPGRHADERAMMVQEQMEKRGIRDQDVLRSIRAVPRHEFVPEFHKMGENASYLDHFGDLCNSLSKY